MLRRTFHAISLGLMLAAAQAGLAQTPAKLVLDWTFEGSHAPFAQTLAKGHFEANGLKVTIDRGYGSGDTIGKVAAGAYDFGYVDVNVLVEHNAKNPQNPVTAVFLLYDTTLNTVIAKKQAGIESLTDLQGRRIAAPAHDNSRLLFPLFAKAAKVDLSKVQWVTVQANVRDAMFVRGEADAVAAIETAKIAMNGLGLADDKLSIFRFSTYLPELLGRGIVVSQKTLRERPELVRAFLRGLVAGTKDAVANPESAIASLTQLDNLTKAPLELARFKLNVDQALLRPNVKANGLSAVTPERARRGFTLVAEAFELPVPADTALLYDSRFLPPAETRRIAVP